MSILSRLQSIGGVLASSAKQTVEDASTLANRLKDYAFQKDEEKLRKDQEEAKAKRTPVQVVKAKEQEAYRAKVSKTVTGATTLVKDIARAPQRAAVSTVLSAKKEKAFTPGTGIAPRLEKFLLGENKVESVRGTGETTVKSFGGSSELAKNIGLPVGVALTALDLIPGAPKKKILQEGGEAILKESAKNLAIPKKSFGSALKGLLKEETPLVAEAKKYKSAEEFVKAKANAYHQTNSDITSFDDRNPVWFGTTRRPTTYGKNTVETFIDYKKPYDKGDFYLSPSEQEKLFPKLKKQGYDAVIFRGTASDPNAISSIVSLEPSKNTFTKSQLTDIWNKANKPTPRFSSAKTIPVSQVSKELPQASREAATIQREAQLGKGLKTTEEAKQIGTSYNDKITRPENYYNIDRLSISDAGKERAVSAINSEQAIKEVERITGARLTNKEAEQLANESVAVLKRPVTREETANSIAEALNTRRQVAADFENGTKNGSQLIEEWTKSKSNATDIARQLQAMKISAAPREMTAIDTMLANIYKAGHDAETVAKAAEGVDFKNVKQVTEWYRKFIKPTAIDWVDLVRYNSMLSSPLTHIVNTTSNLAQSGVVAPIFKVTRGLVDAMKSALTGKARQFYAGEGVAHLGGYFKNVSKATNNFVDTLKGTRAIENIDLRSIPLTTKGSGKVIENILAVPLRLLESADQFFITLSEGAAKSGLEYRASKGVNIGNIDDQAYKDARYWIFRQQKNLEQGHILNAVDTLANAINSLRKSNNPIVSTSAKFAFPFIKTPTEIIKQGLEFSPVGFTTILGAKNKTEQLAKAVMGTTAMGVAGSLLLNSDRLTWAEPVDQKSKNEFRDAGLQQYSLKIGDKWFSYSKLPPVLAFNMAFIAGLDDAIKNRQLDEGQVDTIVQTVGKWMGFWADQSYLKNLGDAVSATKGDHDRAVQYISNNVQQVIPARALLGWITRILDPVQRKADTSGSLLNQQMQSIMMQIPGLSTKVPARINEFGEPIVNKNVLFNAVSPSRMSQEDTVKGEELRDKQQVKAEGKAYRKEQKKFEDQSAKNAKENLTKMNSFGTKEEKIQFLKTLDKDSLDKVIALKEKQMSDVSAYVTELKTYGVTSGVRAKAISDRLKKITDKEEKKTLLKELFKQKVITDPVLKQLEVLMKTK